jgi:ornithine cyclodeaminase
VTQFIGVAELGALMNGIGIERFLKELAGYVRDDFVRWPEFEKSARLASHSEVGVIELMPASDGENYAFKYVNGHPRNTSLGKLTVTAFGVLADVRTGYPRLISEMTLLTALRTGATSALAARHLARKDARSMALIGTGAQGEFQMLAFKAILGISEVRIFDKDPAAMDKFEANIGADHGITVIRTSSTAEACRGADIVTTATADKTRAAVLTAEVIEPGMHINAIGGDCPGKTELAAEILRRARVFVEYTPQTRIEGEIQQMEPDFPVTELWQVLVGRASGRLSPDEVTVFDSVGFAVEDFAALRYVADLASHRQRTELDLIPDLGDPKDLFGALVRDESEAVPSLAVA